MKLNLDEYFEEKLKRYLTDMDTPLPSSQSFGLLGYIQKAERPYADQNAQADVEGRPRPASSYGGIAKGQNAWFTGYGNPKPMLAVSPAQPIGADHD